MKALLLSVVAAAVSGPSFAASTQQQRLQAVLHLQKAVPEFESFCGSFPSAHTTVVQSEKNSAVLTIVVQASIAGKYGVVLIYEVAFRSGFVEVDKILSENLGVNRLTDVAALKNGR